MASRRFILLFLFCAAALSWYAAPAVSAELIIDAPTEVMPRAEFEVRVRATYQRDVGHPTFPTVTGLSVEGPSTHTSRDISMAGGRINSRRTVTWTWLARYDEEGTFELPPITVSVDGVMSQTPAQSIDVRKPSGALPVQVRLTAPRDTYYVGEAIAVSLLIAIKPYQDATHPVNWQPRNSWEQVSLSGSSWGGFRDAAQVSNNMFGRSMPPHELAVYPDEEGVPTTYHEFRLNATLIPRTSGQLDGRQITVVVDYPTRLRRSGDGLAIAGRQRIAVTPDASGVMVLEPPETDQPAIYTGAIGRYEILVRTDEEQVLVGDPINIELILIDRGIDDPRLDTLRPPDLSSVPALLRDFEISSGALAGKSYPGERAKLFRPTLRPRRADVTEIPPIPFAYFDPVQKRYFTVHSAAIPLNVSPTDSLSLDDIEGPAEAIRDEGRGLTEVQGGLQANDIGASLRQRPDPWQLSGWHYAVTGAGPLLAFGAVALRWRGSRRADVTGQRRRGARGRARTALAAARAEQVGALLASYVADRCDRADGALTAADVEDELRQRGAAETLCAEVGVLIRTAERARYGGEHAADELRESALALIERLERESLS